MKKIVVLVSGQGSNLQALIDACQQGRIAATIVAVLSNNAQAYGLQRAEEAGIAAQALDAKSFADREAFDAALAQAIDQYQPDLVVLAGYMRILSNAFVQRYAGRMLNIHPSLLPKYPGLHTHRQAIDNGDAEHGTSVHFVTEQLDGGPVILQAKVPIFPGDEEDEVIERVQTQEHTIYPLVVSWFIEGRLAMRDNAAWLDGERLPAQGYAAD
ncbi:MULTISPECIES: phosphoribosylglycinamide formyltransferase [Serratia]|jgi:phosphoribosylglycinamide formyltransferase-1|uniref:phosphoribosylglycinamide formyltransferase n=1 Tax=Serratia TaxID=613 RepID=UPI0003AE9F05|nr:MULTISPECIES: phosphoribosylglycinamide formyltransferase [Serratia]ERK09299.1 Phosphoribosylglycinamide formyltransferase [Serratia fonticola AU-AP2C]MBP0999945.1 phosphoribosylglycinamide formyltransferase [Serratia fonticola]MBP1005475.1 phosphoribosylglycinamide formyltransferase [Serratia fonticola]MBP1014645.1 phosphoribosylglycinamide formyltransferase [Serratia fonticola]MBP1017360.1 phosphoribosylglycinamide formyltransferase [Serratia fonticola]